MDIPSSLRHEEGMNDMSCLNSFNSTGLANSVDGAVRINRINANNGINNTTYDTNCINGTNGINGANDTDCSYSKVPDQSDVDLGPPPIAICGMAMRLPGGISNAEDFWDFLVNKKDAQCRIPENRFNVDAFYSPIGKTGTIKTQYGYFLQDRKLEHLDTSFFSMNRNEVEKLDPQQRILLEVTRECFENAGEANWRGKSIGCYVGTFGEDWVDLGAKDTQHLGMYRITGSGDFVLANRVSYEYDLKGPSMTIKTGCSSSMICLHEACQALYGGECASAIVGGTNMVLTPTMTIAMTEQGVLSPTGSCKTFDATADGYARGEAINAIYVKKLSDAIRDGNPIRAVIRATSANCDGKTPGISHPSSESHEEMIRRAYSVARLEDFSRTAFIECHGTGTPIGDPLEIHAIANVFGDSGVYIGSVKPNIGHSEGASGISSVIKTVLALENKTIPPNIKFSKPNPKIPFETRRLQVPLEATPWPQNRRERASINSFGIGGANAHVILDSAASFGVSPKVIEPTKTTRLLVFSANHEDSLRRLVMNYQEYIKKQPSKIRDLAYTLGARREHLLHRAFCVTDGSEQPAISQFVKSGISPNVVFVFTGQGAQWAGMGKELMEDYAVFRDVISEMEEVLAQLPQPCPWSIKDELLKPKETSQIYRAEFSQPLCTAVQVGLVEVLASAGIRPKAVVGHSSGEIAAAYASGAINAKQAIKIAYHRGQITKKQTRPGGMAAIGLGRNDVAEYLVNGVVIACENSHNSTTISGDEKELDTVLAKIMEGKPGVLTRRLPVGIAYHSHHMRAVGDIYRRLIEDTESIGPLVPFFSSVTGQQIMEQGELGARYWQKNLESPVLFGLAVTTILKYQAKDQLFLEIGPHPALAGPLRQIFKATGSQSAYVSMLHCDKDSTESVLTALGQLYVKAVPIDFVALNPDGVVLTDLPTYPWHHEEEYWCESRLSKNWRLRKFPHHDLLGSRTAESNDLEPSWRNIIHIDDIPWVRDHKIHDDVVFPFAGYICMAGEAVRQIGFDEISFSMRHTVVGTALVLREGEDTEIMTSLRPVHLTDTLDSAWFEFTISSYAGSFWAKHCVGQIRGGSDHEIDPPAIEDLPRLVPSPRWYEAMRKVGLNYGPEFRGLSDISADTASRSAVATVLNRIGPYESTYQLHPTTIDFCIQLFSVAASNGMPRHFGRLAMPVTIEELYIRRTGEPIEMKVDASFTLRGAITGDAVGTAAGEIVLCAKGVKLSPLDSDGLLENTDRHAAARLEWLPDIDFINPKDLICPSASRKDLALLVEKLSLLCMIETSHKLKSFSIDSTYLNKYRIWLDAQLIRAREGLYDIVQGSQDLTNLSQRDRLDLIRSLRREADSTEAAAAATAVFRVFELSEAVFEGVIDPLEGLLQDNVLTDLYNYMDLKNCKDFIHVLSHNKPTMRILEIGAGTGGATSALLGNLVSSYGERMYATYTYTDISAGFFVAAKERFKDYSNIEYAVLDITKDPIEQGFEAESYDLVLAANVLHATPCLCETLQNVRKLLHPKGHLFLQELCPSLLWINYIMGILPGWWLGEADGRPDQPYVSQERWNKELWAAGFSGTEAVIYDDEQPYQTNASIIARPVKIANIPKRITILYQPGDIASQVEAQFTNQGYGVDFCTLEQKPTANQDVISLLDLESPFFHDISAERFEAFKLFTVSLESSGILWLTRSVQVASEDPRYAMAIGMARTIRSELSLDFATLEVDNIGSQTWQALFQVFEKFQLRSRDSILNPDFEYALSDGVIRVSRFHWTSVTRELSQPVIERAVKKLEIGNHGQLKTLRWTEEEAACLARDQVEIDIRAVGMNFKDVLTAMGIIDATKKGLGLEGAGTISRTGQDVKNLKVGDRVMVLATGCFSTRLITSAQFCTKIPNELSFEDAATMPCVYGTAIYSLMDVGRLEKGHSVLIHSACGGVGIAAIQICQMIGAQIFATVGNEEKVEYLIETFDIPRKRIFNSRNASFLSDLMRKTGGRGVDIVLNSLSGELLHASWKCVAKFGKMIEIGKRDFIGFGKLNMDLFEANRSFCGVDLAQVCIDRPEICNRLLEQCVEYFQRGAIQPIKPTKFFDASMIQECFRYMQKGQHIGKIVVKMPKESNDLPANAVAHTLSVKPDASYLLIGGLGGLGRAVSTWLVECGATHLIYLSPSAGNFDDETFLQELSSQGCTSQAFAGSVSRLADVQNAVDKAVKPIRGVIQLSMVLRDQAFRLMKYEDWEAAVSPKVEGTWNLHEVLRETQLDFFVLFSSISGIVGQWGQSNYAAANAFLDSFVQYRHRIGLPASVLDIGVIEDVGFVSQNPAILQQFKATGSYTLREQDLLDSLQLAIARSGPQFSLSPSSKSSTQRYSAEFTNPSQLIIGLRSTLPLSDPANRTIWKMDSRMSIYQNLETVHVSVGGAANEGLKLFLGNSAINPSVLREKAGVDFLAREIGLKLFNLMLKPEEDLDISASLSAIGVDSLMAIEIRTWWRQTFGFDISILEILNCGSVADLGKAAADGLLAKHPTEAPGTDDRYLVMKAP